MVFRASKKTKTTISLSDPIEAGEDGKGIKLIDVISDNEMLDERYEVKEEIQALKKHIDTVLNGVERQIIILRYGLSNQPPQTQQQVCEILNISRSYVSRLEKKALSKLKIKFTNSNDNF